MLAAPRARLAHLAGCVGWARVPLVAARWTLRREFLITARDLAGALPEVRAGGDEEWTVAGEADLAALLAADPTLDRGELDRRLAEGQSCVVCRADGIAVHWRWQATSPAYLRYLDCRLEPAEGDFVITEVLTRPDQRARGFHARSAVRALHEARDAGHRRLVGFVAPWNRPALRVTLEVSGREVVGWLGYRRTLAGRRAFAEGAAQVVGGGIRLLPSPRVPVP